MGKMPISSYWSLIIASCGVSALGLSWIVYKKNIYNINSIDYQHSEKESNPQLIRTKWVKIGQLTELYAYPLLAGEGQPINKCKLEPFGIIPDLSDNIVRDRMLVVYDAATNRIINALDYPKLKTVSIIMWEENVLQLKAPNYDYCIINMDPDRKYYYKNLLTIWYDSEFTPGIRCTDCGMEASVWLSLYLTGRNYGLRLATCTKDLYGLQKEIWERFTLYNGPIFGYRWADGHMIQYQDYVTCILLSPIIIKKLNEKVKKFSSSFSPNIVIQTQIKIMDDEWEWMKIGTAIIKNNIQK